MRYLERKRGRLHARSKSNLFQLGKTLSRYHVAIIGVCAARVAGKTLRLPGPRINRAANDASTNAETTEPFLSCPAVGNPGCETANARAWGGIGERRNLVSQQDLELV